MIRRRIKEASDRVDAAAQAVYEGARRMAVDVGAIPFDEFPRWVKETE